MGRTKRLCQQRTDRRDLLREHCSNQQRSSRQIGRSVGHQAHEGGGVRREVVHLVWRQQNHLGHDLSLRGCPSSDVRWDCNLYHFKGSENEETEVRKCTFCSQKTLKWLFYLQEIANRVQTKVVRFLFGRQRRSSRLPSPDLMGRKDEASAITQSIAKPATLLHGSSSLFVVGNADFELNFEPFERWKHADASSVVSPSQPRIRTQVQVRIGGKLPPTQVSRSRHVFAAMRRRYGACLHLCPGGFKLYIFIIHWKVVTNHCVVIL